MYRYFLLLTVPKSTIPIKSLSLLMILFWMTVFAHLMHSSNGFSSVSPTLNMSSDASIRNIRPSLVPHWFYKSIYKSINYSLFVTIFCEIITLLKLGVPSWHHVTWICTRVMHKMNFWIFFGAPSRNEPMCKKNLCWNFSLIRQKLEVATEL